MEFLGLESERSLALRIAAVPSGKDNLRRGQERHSRAPPAPQLKRSTDRVADRREQNRNTKVRIS